MTRPVELSRDEAEFIIEACEADGALQWQSLAQTLREQWGMPTRAAGEVGLQ